MISPHLRPSIVNETGKNGPGVAHGVSVRGKMWCFEYVTTTPPVALKTTLVVYDSNLRNRIVGKHDHWIKKVGIYGLRSGECRGIVETLGKHCTMARGQY